MKRVQLIVEAWQHEWLAQEAARQSTSMSALLRELLSEAIDLRQAGSSADDPIWGIVGLGEGPDDGVTSENLDTFLYRVDRSQSPVKTIAESPASDTEDAA